MPQYQINVPGKGTFRVNSPTDLTDVQVWEAVQGQLASAPAPALAPSTERTVGEAFKDIGASVVGGFGSLLQVPGQLAQLVPGLQGVGQAIAKPGEALEDVGERLKSEGLKVREALRSKAISEAEKDGILSSFATAITETVKDPALLSTFITGQLPQLLGPAAAAKVGKAVVLSRSGLEGAELAAQAGKIGTRSAVGAGAAMQGADISADAYKQALEAAQKQGMSEEDANAAALLAARKAFALATPISVLSQALPGGSAIERRLAGVAGKGRLKSAIGEAVSEAAEEGGGAFATNVGVLGVDPTRELTQGVGAAAGLGTIGGGILGGVLGKAPAPELPPELRPGETDRQAAERIQAEILAMKEAAKPPAPGPILDTNNLYTLMAQPNGYALVEQYKQRLAELPETEETKAAIEEASFIQRRSIIEGLERQPTKAVLNDKILKKMGFKPKDGVYESLLGMDMASPDQADEITQTLSAVRAQEDITPAFVGKIDNAINVVNDLQQRIYPKAPPGAQADVGEAVTPPSGEGVPLAVQPSAGAAPTGLGVTEPSGVVPPVADVGQPAGRAEAQPLAVAAPIAPSVAEVATQPVVDQKTVETPKAEELPIPLTPRLQSLTNEEKSLFNFNEALQRAKQPITGFDWDAVTDSPSPDGRGMTPEKLIFSLNGAVEALKVTDGKLRSQNRTGATPQQLIEQWTTASQIQSRIDQSKQESPELWSNYDQRQKEIQSLKVGDEVQLPDGEVGKLDAKFAKNWRVVFPNPTESRLGGEKTLLPSSVLRPVEVPAPTISADIPAAEIVTVPTTTKGAVEQHAVKGLPIIEAPIEQLSISKDVPQFKSEADVSGIVKPLEGKFERTGVAPIQLWRRTDGRLEVISGRHRFDLAKRSGETTIPAQIHDEAAGFDAAKAATLDAELNIRDEQGEVKDYVTYFERSGISEADAKARGLLGRPVGQRGWTIASKGSPDLIAAHRAGIVPDDAAAGIAAVAPGDARLQSVGIKAVRDNKSAQAAVNTVQAVKALAAEKGAPEEEAGDLFGFDDSAIKEAEEMARIATEKQRAISSRLAAITGAANKPAVAKAEGIDIKDEVALNKRVQELRQVRAAWNNWSSNPDLIKEIRDEMTKPVEPKKSLVEMRKRYEAGRAAPAPVETKPEPTELDKEIEAKIEELGRVLSRIMGRFGLKDVALNLVEDMKAEGEYAQSVIRLALDAASPVQALRHESIHALKELGFFTPQQWAALEKQAKSKWIDQYLKNVNINKEPLGDGEKSRYDAYMDLYKGDMDAIIEEAIADAFGDFDVNKAPPGMMQAILTRLRNFFDAVKTAFGGEITAEQVFRKVEKGELKAEAAPAEAATKQSLREVPLSTRGLMEVQPVVAMQELGLKTDAVRKPGGIELFNDVRSIALALNQDTIRNRGQIAKTDTSLTSEKELARAMVDEIGYQLRATADTGTGKGWYSDNYPKAVKKLGKLFPELETDPYARTVFSALVAITSNGEKVSLNVKNAIKLYEDIRMGKDPRGIGSRRQKALDNNLAVVLQLMKQYGPTGMRNELLREITVKDMNAILRSRGEKPDTSYLADTKVPAAALYFGPKLGAFFSNLEGAEGYLTMDMWWTRTVNRMRGQLESKATEASIKKFANMMDKPNATREEVVAATIPLRNKYEEFGWHTELEELVGKKEPAEDKDKPAWTAKAKRKAGPAYEALLFEHRLEKMANTIYKNEYELLEEAPFTSTDREFMYRTARRAQSLLKAEGINLSLADIQAALWYYEKRLYQHLSGRKADDIGYDEAITQLARESTGPARPSVVFGGQPVSGTGPAGAGAAATGVGGKPAKPSLRSTSAAEAFNPKEIEANRSPDYKGREKLIDMPINDFLSLANDETDKQKLILARQRLDQGKQFTSLPYLQINLDDRVDGHEGRHRAKALLEKGYTTMPVILRMAGLRWSEQADPQRFDYRKDWPETIRAQERAADLDLRLPFPVSREESMQPYGETAPRYSLRSTIPTAARQRIVQTTISRDEKTFYQRIIEAISPNNFQSFRADALNRYDQLSVYDKKLAQKMGGKALLASSSAESAALFSDLGAGLTASALGVHDRMGGVPVYRNGVTIISNKNGTVKGPTAIFAPLAKQPGDYQAYQYWAAVKRGLRFIYTIDPKTGQPIEKLITAADGPIAEALRKQYLRDFKIDFDAIQKEWIKYNDGLVDYMLATGVLSQDRADIYKQYADYLPFYRQMDGVETVGPKIFQSISGIKPPKKLKGGEAPIDDFLENIVRNTQSAIQAGIKNIAAQRAAEVATKIDMAERLKYHSTAPNVFHVYENGKPVSYETQDQLFINAIKSLGLPDLPFIGLFSGPANLLRNLVTKDPGFMLANLMRDSMSAWVTSGVKMTPMVDTITNFGSALAGKSPEFQALMNSGILGGYEFSQNVEQSGREFGKALRKQANVKQPGMKGVLEMGAKPFTSLWEALEKGSTASDAATRMEVYKKTLAETGNEAEALHRALEVMNFNRKGSSAVIRVLTAAVPFLNARMQGLDVLYRAGIGPALKSLKGEPLTDQQKAVMKSFFVRGATLAALSTFYWAMTHDDDEYKKQEQETRDNYWLLPSLGVKIPIPFEIGVLFKVIPERILGYTMGSDTGEDFLKSMARQLTSTLAFNPIPQTVLPVVESMTNFSFFTMRPIVGQGLEGLQPAYQVGPGTSRIAEKIGAATKSLPTELQISPAKLDQMISGYTGTMGMYMVNLMDAVFDMNTDSPKPSRRFEQMPLIRRFAIDPEARGSVTAYYELKNSVDSIVRTSNMLERTMNYEELPAYLQDNAKMLATKDYLLDLEKTMKEFREMKILIRSAKMSAEAKGDAIASIEKMENQLTANIQYLKSLAKGG